MYVPSKEARAERPRSEDGNESEPALEMWPRLQLDLHN